MNLQIQILPIFNFLDNSISPIFGFSKEFQAGKEHIGPNYGFLLYSNDDILFDENLYFSYNSYYLNEKLDDNLNKFRNNSLSLIFTYSNKLKNRFNVSYNRKAKHNYIVESYSIINQMRDENVYSISNNFEYFSENIQASLGMNYQFKNINKMKDILKPKTIFDINSNYKESEFLLSPSIILLTNEQKYFFKFDYYSKTSDFAVIQGGIYDFNLLQQKIAYDEQNNSIFHNYRILFGFNNNFDKINSLSLEFYNLKSEFDTPSNLNNDDRDELQQFAILGFKQNYDNLQCNYKLELGRNIISYIKKEKSSYNTTTKRIKFSTLTSYKNNFLSNYNQNEISSYYTIYKYKIDDNNSDYVLRQYSFNDSLLINLGTIFDISLITNIKLNEFGNLFWDKFEMYPLRKTEEYYYQYGIIFKFPKIKFLIGIRNYYYIKYKYENKYYKENKYYSIGPVLNGNIDLYNIETIITGNYEQMYFNNYRKNNFNFSITMRMKLN